MQYICTSIINKGKIKKTIEMNNSVVVDVGEKGKIIGIEILNFSHQQDKKNNLANLLEFGVPMQMTDEATKVA